MDKVKPLKIESAIDGTQSDPFPVETDPDQDYLATKGVAFENTDTKVLDLSPSGEIRWKDSTQTVYKTLNSISAGAIADVIVKEDAGLVMKNDAGFVLKG